MSRRVKNDYFPPCDPVDTQLLEKELKKYKIPYKKEFCNRSEKYLNRLISHVLNFDRKSYNRLLSNLFNIRNKNRQNCNPEHCLRHDEIVRKTSTSGSSSSGRGTMEKLSENISKLRLEVSSTVISKIKYSEELKNELSGKCNPQVAIKREQLDIEVTRNLSKNLSHHSLKNNKSIKKCSFVYLLLDPRKLKQHSFRKKTQPKTISFEEFVESIFYVGKGKHTRPQHHLIQAQKLINHDYKMSTEFFSDKIRTITDIWQQKLGVVSIHAFNNSTSIEALTREAAIIACIGLANITNKINGQFYGSAINWNDETKCNFGVINLIKLYKMFLIEGVRPIYPQDVQ